MFAVADGGYALNFKRINTEQRVLVALAEGFECGKFFCQLERKCFGAKFAVER